MSRYFKIIPPLRLTILLGSVFSLNACNELFTGSLFESQYPHQRYLAELEQAGLEHSILYRQWEQAARRSLTAPANTTIPYQESAFISSSAPNATSYLFAVREGERLQVDVQVQSSDSVQVFVDLFAFSVDTAKGHRHLVSADPGEASLTWNVRRDDQYVLRIQPELLAEVSFDLRITADASLANPVDRGVRQYIGSVFGDPRDGGARRHEGIDIFADRLTPVVAAAEGTVTRVGNNRLGGKVIWLRPKDDRQISLYYAHLDSQLVSSGQSVRAGDTLGLMGNTGNAVTTPPHLHFGIYRPGGAVDPLPYVQPGKSDPPPISADRSRIGDTMRIRENTEFASRHTPVVVESASRNSYRVLLPDGGKRTMGRREIVPLARLRTVRLSRSGIVYAQPNSAAARLASLPEGERIGVIAEYGTFLLVDAPLKGWVISAEP